ncbi:3-dehydroquinate synthase [Compostibacter hankyongensis]|uniref:3-dehydroquinate synthase n=1 Tax=Compostibacter hankyongensis TaxID=1007089 RepID=A0ABP8FIL9_9BACT
MATGITVSERILQQEFTVRYRYPVFFTQHIFDPANACLRRFLEGDAGAAGRKVLCVLDGGMLAHHPGLEETIAAYLENIPGIRPAPVMPVLPGGEQVKNDPAFYEAVVTAVEKHGIDRHSWLLAVGGGSLLDMAGYAAAVAHRGIRHIRIPTTVLSQNDSGVGVKNGINCFGKKNFLGTFAPPAAVFNDGAFLSTLSMRDWRSGIAEAVKVALIRDPDFFSWLEAHADALVQRDETAMAGLVYRCAQLHLEHIAGGDPFEKGASRPLDYGHWSAHKLEQLTAFSLRHGEAVAIGMMLDVVYARLSGMLASADEQRIFDLMRRLGFSWYHPALEDPALLQGLEEFREHLGGMLTILLLRGIGRGEDVHTMDTARIKEAIQLLRTGDNGHFAAD